MHLRGSGGLSGSKNWASGAQSMSGAYRDPEELNWPIYSLPFILEAELNVEM